MLWIVLSLGYILIHFNFSNERGVTFVKLPDEGDLSPTERYMKDYPDMHKELGVEHT